jgi:hypothetical protein
MEEIIVGIIKNNSMKKNKKVAAPPTQFWKPLVKLWFDLFEELLPPVDGLPAKPAFDTIEAYQYKIIIRDIKKRAEEREIEWNQKNALLRTEAFLRKAWEDNFVSKNYMLRIISNNRSKIFNNQITPKYVAPRQNKEGSVSRRGNLESPVATIKSKGGFGKL